MSPQMSSITEKVKKENKKITELLYDDHAIRTPNLNSSDFTSDFVAASYCGDYYQDLDMWGVYHYAHNGYIPYAYANNIGEENVFLVTFFADVVKHFLEQEPCLNRETWFEVGGGPTIYQLISAAPLVQRIIFSDYVENNLDEIRLWCQQPELNQQWFKFIYASLLIERRTTDQVYNRDITVRTDCVKDTIQKLVRYDVINDVVYDSESKLSSHNIVSTNFCLESITDDIQVWYRALENAIAHVKTGGTLVMSSLAGAVGYIVGNTYFPACYLTEDLIYDALKKSGMKVKHMSAMKTDMVHHGYKGFVFSIAKKD